MKASKSPATKPPKPALTPLSVTEIAGEFFRFHCGSRSSPGKEYLVDLEENDWAGRCGCIHFEMKCQPKLNKGHAPCDGLRCSHIRRCRSYLLDEILPKLAKQLRKGQEQHHGNEKKNNVGLGKAAYGAGQGWKGNCSDVPY